jgi:hypothetical protein
MANQQKCHLRIVLALSSTYETPGAVAMETQLSKLELCTTKAVGQPPQLFTYNFSRVV